MKAESVFSFGLVAFGFLGMGPVTIAVDSYGPVTDNAQSVYELSLIEQVPNVAAELKRDFDIDVDFEHAKHLLEENDGAGNTFKATAKPVLIGTAVVGATTMIFSIIVILTRRGADPRIIEALGTPRTVPPGPAGRRRCDLLVHGRSTPAVITTGGFTAPVEFIKAHMHGWTKAPRKRRSKRANRSSKSARNTPRRGCSISSWWCSS